MTAFDLVSFRFGRADAGVHGMSFRVEPGEFIGVVGPSGGGKTTIIDLLLGFYSPYSGPGSRWGDRPQRYRATCGA